MICSLLWMRFSSMLDIGKLIRALAYLPRRRSFSSMLDIGKLIRRRPSGQK